MNGAKAAILLVEDDANLARGLLFNLEREGFAVRHAADLRTAHALLASGEPDLVLLDLALPDGDGLDLLRTLREDGRGTGVICLTARGQESDVVMGLDLGADDYVVKPFGLQALFARIHAVLRRAARATESAPSAAIRLEDGSVDLRARRVRRKGGECELTPIEAELLRYLAARAGEAVDRRELLKDLWGVDRHFTTRTLDNHVARLRKKIEVDAARPRILVTAHGIGYRLDAGTSP